MSAVYFARFGDYVKIGFADNPRKRLKEIANRASKRLIYPDDFDFSLPGDLVLVIPFCRMRDERNMQLLFANHWAVGEWFHWSPAFRYQMETMRFVPHAVRLKDLRAARRSLGIVPGGAVKEEHWGKQTREILEEAASRRDSARQVRAA